jgi:hypothetical protein
MGLKQKYIAEIGSHCHFGANSYAMSAMNTGVGNCSGFYGNGLGRAILHTFQAAGTFLELNKWHNNQI